MKILEALKSAATRSAIAVIVLVKMVTDVAWLAFYGGLAYLGWLIWRDLDAWYFMIVAVGLMLNGFKAAIYAFCLLCDLLLLIIGLICPSFFYDN